MTRKAKLLSVFLVVAMASLACVFSLNPKDDEIIREGIWYLAGYVWEDADGNGIQGPGELPRADVRVVVYGIASSGNEHELSAGTTGPDGFYEITVLNPVFDSYFLEAVSPDNLLPTKYQQGLDTSLDNDFDSSLRTEVTKWTLVGWRSQDREERVDPIENDLGLLPMANVGDFVWIDANGNGIQDTGEEGLEGVEVTLYIVENGAGRVVSTDTTDGEGKYLFENLVPGTYYLSFVPDGDYEASPMDVGDDGSDSDISEEDWSTEEFELVQGEDRSRDAGFIPPASSEPVSCPVVEDQVSGETTTPEGYVINWAISQDGEFILNMCYVAVDANGTPAMGPAFASFFNAADPEPGSHAEEVFDTNGMAVFQLPIFYPPGETVDAWAFFEELAKAIVLTPFTLAP